ncbi:MAG: hypothetical protein ABIG71_04435 [Candidatus Uhrbacteria bacterium]
MNDMYTGPATPNTYESTPIDLFGIIGRRWRAGVLIVVVALLFGIGSGFLFPGQYSSDAMLRIGARDGTPIETVGHLQELIRSSAVELDIAEQASIRVQDIRDHVILEETKDGRGIIVRGTGGTPEEAHHVVLGMSTYLLEYLLASNEPMRITLQQEMQTLRKEREMVEQEIVQLEQQRSRLVKDATVYQREIAKRADASSEAQGRIVESYIGLLAEARAQQDAMVQSIINKQQRIVVIQDNIQRKEADPGHLNQPPTIEAQAQMPGESFLPPQFFQRVILAAILGIFMAFVWAFVHECHIVRRRPDQRYDIL